MDWMRFDELLQHGFGLWMLRKWLIDDFQIRIHLSCQHLVIINRGKAFEFLFGTFILILLFSQGSGFTTFIYLSTCSSRPLLTPENYSSCHLAVSKRQQTPSIEATTTGSEGSEGRREKGENQYSKSTKYKEGRNKRSRRDLPYPMIRCGAQSSISCILNMLVVTKRELALGTKHMNMSSDFRWSRVMVGLSDHEIPNCFHTAICLFFWPCWHLGTLPAVVWPLLKRPIISQYLGNSYRRWRGGEKSTSEACEAEKTKKQVKQEKSASCLLLAPYEWPPYSYRKVKDLLSVSFDS